jgi:hypothetical protein
MLQILNIHIYVKRAINLFSHNLNFYLVTLYKWRNTKTCYSSLIIIAKHSHQGWCPPASAFDYSVWYRSFRYRTGSPYFRTRLALASEFFLFLAHGTRLPGCLTALNSGIYENCTQVEGRTPCPFILLVVKRHRARGIHTIPLVVERHPAHPYCWWWKDTVCCGRRTPCISNNTTISYFKPVNETFLICFQPKQKNCVKELDRVSYFSKKTMPKAWLPSLL